MIIIIIIIIRVFDSIIFKGALITSQYIVVNTEINIGSSKNRELVGKKARYA